MVASRYFGRCLYVCFAESAKCRQRDSVAVVVVVVDADVKLGPICRSSSKLGMVGTITQLSTQGLICGVAAGVIPSQMASTSM